MSLKFERLKLPQKEIEILYSKKYWSSYKIAKMLNCSPDTIRHRLRLSGKTLRTLKESKTKALPLYPRHPFSGNLFEKAYLLGFCIGDIHVSQTSPSSPTIRVSANSTKSEQINLFKKLFNRYGHIWVGKKDTRGAIATRCYLDLSFDFLLKKRDEVPEWVMQSKANQTSFFSGYFDAEGTCCLVRDKATISVKSQDKQIIIGFFYCLQFWEIYCQSPLMTRRAGHISNSGIKTNRDVWQFTIYRIDSILRFNEVFGKLLRHEKRLKDLAKAVRNVNDR